MDLMIHGVVIPIAGGFTQDVMLPARHPIAQTPVFNFINFYAQILCTKVFSAAFSTYM
jgi:hypothetical protein